MRLCKLCGYTLKWNAPFMFCPIRIVTEQLAWRHLSDEWRTSTAPSRRETFAKSIESVTSQKTDQWKEKTGWTVAFVRKKCPATGTYHLRERAANGTRECS